MPESRKRKDISRSASGNSTVREPKLAPSPSWWAPVMVALLIIGLLIVMTTYLTGAAYPIPGIGRWNIAVGFGTLIAGMLMSMGWR